MIVVAFAATVRSLKPLLYQVDVKFSSSSVGFSNYLSCWYSKLSLVVATTTNYLQLPHLIFILSG